ncbi:hypothetical protein midi_00172 [Candidatus Midichloria mitochondrii IricVA]|uniref:Uncharacterized protein n=1 Tax=Midichloria mitochondrii (strain IricVA) TaxID=696127 RepID=F7XUZ3_MIDMI|nr:hypothetical protein midi_00172 [Candidatus Midichloria mitochondrii IricVA]
MGSQPLFCDGAWRFYSIRKRCNHLYMLIYNVPQSLNDRFRWVALLPSPTSKSIISPAPLSTVINIKVYPTSILWSFFIYVHSSSISRTSISLSDFVLLQLLSNFSCT